jgi:hypothetical protein
MEQKRTPYRSKVNGEKGPLVIRGKEPGFEYRIANDSDNRIIDLQERGYEVVTHVASVGDKRVGTPKKEGTPHQISVGQNKKGYLMRIKKEWYDEDQLAKLEEPAELESGLKGNSNSDYGKLNLKDNPSSK